METTPTTEQMRDVLREVSDFLRQYYRSGIRVASKWKELDEKIAGLLGDERKQ